MAEALHRHDETDEVSGIAFKGSVTSSDQLIDPWCEPCLLANRTKIKPIGLCSECNTFICKSCYADHKAWPQLQNHRILRDARMPKSFAEKPVKYKGCKTHIGYVSKHFCNNHHEMICSECIKQTHQRCNTTTIKDMCKFICSDEIDHFKTVVKNVKLQASTTKAVLEKNIAHLETQKINLIQKSKDERDKIIAKAYEIFDETIVDINAVCEKEKCKITEKITTVTDEIYMLEDIIDSIERTITAHFDQNIFIQVQETVKKTRDCQIAIENISKQLQKIEFSISMSDEIATFLNYSKPFGDIKKVLTPVNTGIVIMAIVFPPSLLMTKATIANRKTVNMLGMSVKKLSSLNSRTINDISDCCINGMAVTDNGTLLVSDENNRSVKVFSQDHSLLSSIPFSHCCYDVAVITATTAVVSTEDYKLHFLDISVPDAVSVQRSILLGYWVSGLASYNDKLAVTAWSSPESVKMITTYGKELWSVSKDSSGHALFKYPETLLITEIKDKKTVLVPDCVKESLTFLDANDGTVLRIINLEGKSPRGLSADDDGNMFVCYENTQEVCVWPSDFTVSRVLVAGESIRPNPMRLTYDPSARKLFISYYESDEIDIFEISV